MARVWFLFAVLFGLIPTVTAQSLFKCIDPGGMVSFQSDPCPARTTQAWVRNVTPEPPLSPQQQAALAAKRRQDHADARELSQKAGTGQVTSAGRGDSLSASPCAVARTEENAYRKAKGLHITHDELRRLGDRVYEACKHTR